MLRRDFALLLCVLFLCLGPASYASPLLVTTQDLAQRLTKSKPVLIDMSDATQYQRFHLVDAISLPYEILVINHNNISMPIPQEKLTALLGTLGIDAHTDVVIYDDTGGLNAARLYWELEQLGHTQMALLDGGLVKWILEGRPVTNQPAIAHATTYQISKPARLFLANLKEVAAISRKKEVVLLDVRSEDEYRGDPRIPRSGHIPGAKWWEWDQAVDFDHGFVQRDAATLRESLSQLGLTDLKQPIITYCHSSHRASQAYYTLKRLGYTNVKIYGGSILEYEQNKDLPLQRGVAP